MDKILRKDGLCQYNTEVNLSRTIHFVGNLADSATDGNRSDFNYYIDIRNTASVKEKMISTYAQVLEYTLSRVIHQYSDMFPSSLDHSLGVLQQTSTYKI